ncbi:MAG TPA: nuclear transport factor 2 family protein [Jatrophihabitantaceae bacterium]|jgi:ketosteroid isomerase-like protein
MTQAVTPQEVFHRLVDGVCRLVGGDASQAENLAELYAERTHVEHPMALPSVDPLLTRDDLRRHFTGGPIEPIPDYRATDIVVHETADPEVIVAEFAYRGSVAGREFRVPCVFVLRVRDGQIVESRDYISALDRVRAVGGLDGLVDQLRTAPAK